MTTEPPTLTSQRLRLVPLRVEDAAEMALVLADPRLYAFTGGEPPSAEELRRRYAAQVVGRSPDGAERWLNWVIRRAAERDAIGFTQATVRAVVGDDPQAIADVAWVVGVPWQGQGFASEAARTMAAWLVAPEPAGAGATEITAHVRAGHGASEAVARGLGLEPTAEIDDGEVVWRADARRVRLRALGGRSRGAAVLGDEPSSST